MACPSCFSRSRVWMVSAYVFFFLTIVLVVGAIITKAVIYPKFTFGIDQARYTDNTHQSKSCKNLFVGDATCGEDKFNAFKLTTQEAFDLCMQDDKPSSYSDAAASGWCEDGKDGCSKPESCNVGKDVYLYPFTISNVEAVMEGEKPIVQEVQPVKMKKNTYNVVDDDRVYLWNRDGIAEYKPVDEYKLADPEDSDRWNEFVVVPHVGMFNTLNAPAPGARDDVPVHVMVHAVAAFQFYNKLNSMLLPVASVLAELGLDAEKLLEMEYRAANMSRTLGLFGASPNCETTLADALKPFNATVPAFAVPIITGAVCSGEDVNKLLLKGFSGIPTLVQLLQLLDVSLPLPGALDNAFFYAYDKNCTTDTCRLTDANICGNASLPSYATCIEPSLSEDQARAVMDVAKLDPIAHAALIQKNLGGFLTTCNMAVNTSLPAWESVPRTNPADPFSGFIPFSPALCEKVVSQLNQAGRFALLKADAATTTSLLQAYGWWNATEKDGGDLAKTGRKVIPYFVRTKLGGWMSYNTSDAIFDPLSKAVLALPAAASTQNISAVKPTQQRVSSRFGVQGLSTFVMSAGLTHCCKFSRGCFSQKKFVESNGELCDKTDVCVPNEARGFDLDYLPGTVFGSRRGVEKYHEEGAEVELFVDQLFTNAKLVLDAKDSDWSGVKVDKWKFSNLTIRTENCNLAPLSPGRGIDCVSPVQTVNLEYFFAQSLSTRMPVYASFPFYSKFVKGIDERFAPYDPVSRVDIRKCDGCSDDYESEVWSEPNSGKIVKGDEKLQLSFRLRRFGSIGGFPVQASQEANDFLVPIYWIRRFGEAKSYNLGMLRTLQGGPKTFDTIFWLLLGFGIFVWLMACFCLYRGLVLRRKERAVVGPCKAIAMESGTTQTELI